MISSLASAGHTSEVVNHCVVRDVAAGLTFCVKLVVWLCQDVGYS